MLGTLNRQNGTSNYTLQSQRLRWSSHLHTLRQRGVQDHDLRCRSSLQPMSLRDIMMWSLVTWNAEDDAWWSDGDDTHTAGEGVCFESVFLSSPLSIRPPLPAARWRCSREAGRLVGRGRPKNVEVSPVRLGASCARPLTGHRTRRRHPRRVRTEATVGSAQTICCPLAGWSLGCEQ